MEEEAKGVEEEDTGKFKQVLNHTFFSRGNYFCSLFQASGSYQDYFAAKMAALKAQV